MAWPLTHTSTQARPPPLHTRPPPHTQASAALLLALLPAARAQLFGTFCSAGATNCAANALNSCGTLAPLKVDPPLTLLNPVPTCQLLVQDGLATPMYMTVGPATSGGGFLLNLYANQSMCVDRKPALGTKDYFVASGVASCTPLGQGLFYASFQPEAGPGQPQPGPQIDQGTIALIVVGSLPILILVMYAVYKTLAISCVPAPAPPAPAQRALGATSKLPPPLPYEYDEYGRPAPSGRGSPGRSAPVSGRSSPARSGSPEITNALMRVLPTSAFRMCVERGGGGRASFAGRRARSVHSPFFSFSLRYSFPPAPALARAGSSRRARCRRAARCSGPWRSRPRRRPP